MRRRRGTRRDPTGRDGIRWWPRAMLADLPEMDRTIVLLHLMGAMTLDQIADRIGLPVDDVQRNFLKSCERMRATLAIPADEVG